MSFIYKRVLVKNVWILKLCPIYQLFPVDSFTCWKISTLFSASENEYLQRLFYGIVSFRMGWKHATLLDKWSCCKSNQGLFFKPYWVLGHDTKHWAICLQFGMGLFGAALLVTTIWRQWQWRSELSSHQGNQSGFRELIEEMFFYSGSPAIEQGHKVLYWSLFSLGLSQRCAMGLYWWLGYSVTAIVAWDRFCVHHNKFMELTLCISWLYSMSVFQYTP